MKFNGYQEAAILERLALVIPQVDSTELWYGYLQPWFNEREQTPAGAIHLANSSEELAYTIKILAVDFVVKHVQNYASDYNQAHYLLEHLPEEVYVTAAQLMGDAITASMTALQETPVYG